MKRPTLKKSNIVLVKDVFDAEDKEEAKRLAREIAKKKQSNLIEEFEESRKEFVIWYKATVKKTIDWAHPSVAIMFACWVNGFGVKDWTPEETLALARSKNLNTRRKREEIAVARRQREKL